MLGITIGIVVEGATEAIVIIVDDLGERFGQEDVIGMNRMFEEWRYLVGHKARYTAANRRNEKRVLRMRLGKRDKLIHVGFDSLYPTLHGRNGVALSLQANTLSPYGAEALHGDTGCTTCVHARQIATEDKHLVRLQLRNPFRCKCSRVHN